MKTIIIFNQKGGVGKTTTARDISAGLGAKGRKVLAVDMDPQENLTFSMLGKQSLAGNTYQLLVDDELQVESIIRNTDEENVDIIPSHIDLAAAAVELSGEVGGQMSLKDKLDKLKRNQVYDYVIIDAPPSLGILAINSLAAADLIIIPVDSGIFALSGIKKLLTIVEKVQRKLGRPDLEIFGVLNTKFDNTNVSKDIRSELKRKFGSLLFDTVIPKNVSVEEAHINTSSIYKYDPESKGAIAYGLLVDEIINRAEK